MVQQLPLKTGDTSTHFAINFHPNIHMSLPRGGDPALRLPRRWDGQEATGGDAGHPGRSRAVEELGVTQSQKPQGKLWQATKVETKQAVRSRSKAKIRCRGGEWAAATAVTSQE